MVEIKQFRTIPTIDYQKYLAVEEVTDNFSFKTHILDQRMFLNQRLLTVNLFIIVYFFKNLEFSFGLLKNLDLNYW